MTRPAVQPALLQMPGATEGTTQWKGETLQMVNWGGFQGHAQMTISPGATLLSGASGTGKSTLLDAYLALMMPSDTPFNGASNDATAGRARGTDQRNLLTYLRGKLDTSREAGTGELTDQVLRGIDSATWGAVAMTFVDDNGRRFTALRAYFVPRGATRSSEITMKMATIDGRLDLCELEALRASHFDKRALATRWAGMTVHNTYSDFSQTLFTRLGIGAGGDGGKALRLLARIQGGQQVRTVDGLYKSMVLEEPATYAAADKAVGHFTDLDASYEAMVTEAEKAKLLDRVPELHNEREEARATEELIDTFGVHRDGDTPFLLWQLRAEDRLLEIAVVANREKRRILAEQFKAARELEGDLADRVEDIVEQRKANGGNRLDTLKRELEALEGKREATVSRRTQFDDRTACLAISPATYADFGQRRSEAKAFLATFDTQRDELERRQRDVREAGYPLSVKRDELQQEHDSLKGRSGLVPKRLHEARLAIARAAGIDPAELPFVAELIDIAAGEQQWRKGAEVTLFSVARVMLVDQRRLDPLSTTIDPIPLPFRIQFEGVELRSYADSPSDQNRISGKLLYKDSPFTAWVQERVRRRGTDALCVNDPADLRGDGPRVTRNGQTRNGSRGAHGELGDAPIIGFSNTERLAQIIYEIAELDVRLGELGRNDQALAGQLKDLWQHKQAHQYVADCEWDSIDAAAVDGQIRDREAERDRILKANDVLRALQVEEERLRGELEQARSARFGADSEREKLDAKHLALVERQDQITTGLDRIETGNTARLTDAQAEHLDVVFASVGSPDDLDDFPGGVRRLRSRLAEDSRAARDREQAATRSLCGIFEAYQGRWPDPNLGVAIESYSGYRDILDNITATGLHERRQEWRRRLSEWSGQDLVPLNGAFDTAIEDIEDRLLPVNAILAELPFGPAQDRLRISLRRLNLDDITRFRRELKELSSGVTQDLSDDEIELRFTRLRAFIARIRRAETGTKAGPSNRDTYLDVRKHVEITAVRVNATGVDVATYASLGGKSGGETQELVAFIVGAALRFQLGDEDRARPRFAPIFLDEGFVKSDSEFAGRAVNAWKGLGFQLIVGAPLDKVTALEPDMDLVLTMTKSPNGYSHIMNYAPQANREDTEQVLDDVQRLLGNTWHLDVDQQPHAEGPPAGPPSWPHSFPLGTVPKAILERDFERLQRQAFVWRDWAVVHGLTLTDAPRVVHGTTQGIPTHVTIPDIDAAAKLCGTTWVNRLERGRTRAAALRRSFPHITNLARIVRDIDGYTEVDFGLLCVTAEWFRQHSAGGLTPRQVPIPGLHAKWLNTRHATVATLAGLSALDLLPRHPARLHFTYLDPGHRAAGRRWHDSATVGDPMMPAYLPSVVVISENKDTALHFPALDAGISVEGMGHGGATAASVPWLRECPNLFYWGDMDASGLEILDGFRAAGVPVTSVLMDLATYERYERFGTSTDARGNPLTATACRPLAHLTAAEQQLYECLLDPSWTRYRRVEQERILLSVAAEAVQAQLAAHPTPTT